MEKGAIWVIIPVITCIASCVVIANSPSLLVSLYRIFHIFPFCAKNTNFFEIQKGN